MPMRIDQVGLPAGEPGFARKDGVPGAEVTLTDTTPGGTTLFEILWVSPEDTSAINSLAATSGDDHVWKFTPSPGVKGPIRIRLTHTVGGIVTSETRIFGIADNGKVPPAPGERSDPNASRLNQNDPAVIARCERNWRTTEFPNGNPFGWSFDLAASTAAPGGGGVDVTQLIATPAFTAAPDHSYLVLVPATMTFPDALDPANKGKRFTVSATAPLTLTLPPSNFLVTPEGTPQPTPAPLVAGTYEFRAIVETTIYPFGFWACEGIPQSKTRRSVDVDFVYPTKLPSDSQVNNTPAGKQIVAGVGSTQPLYMDGDSFNPGDTIMLAYDTNEHGLYRVVRANGPDDWEFAEVEQAPMPASLPGGADVEYIVRRGEVFRGTRLLTASRSPNYSNEPLEIQLPAMRFWPGGGALVDGASSWQGYPGGTLHLNKVNQVGSYINDASPIVCNIWLNPDVVGRYEHVRLAVMYAWTTQHPVEVHAPPGFTIEAPGNLLLSDVAVLDGGQRMYAEWMLDGVRFRLIDYRPMETGA